MKTMNKVLLGVLLLLNAWTSAAPARPGGQDFPFFCRIESEDDEVNGFRLVADERFASGYALELYEGNRYVAYVGASIDSENDPDYVQIYARQEKATWFKDREILALVGKVNGDDSSGDVKKTVRGVGDTMSGSFVMKPMRCR